MIENIYVINKHHSSCFELDNEKIGQDNIFAGM